MSEKHNHDNDPSADPLCKTCSKFSKFANKIYRIKDAERALSIAESQYDPSDKNTNRNYIETIKRLISEKKRRGQK